MSRTTYTLIWEIYNNISRAALIHYNQAGQIETIWSSLRRSYRVLINTWFVSIGAAAAGHKQAQHPVAAVKGNAWRECKHGVGTHNATYLRYFEDGARTLSWAVNIWALLTVQVSGYRCRTPSPALHLPSCTAPVHALSGTGRTY